LIRFHNISTRREGKLVLQSISAEAPSHSLTLLLGRSGSGKSTLLRLVNRLTEFHEGTIACGGRDIREQDVYALRRSIGFVPQNLGLFPHRTAAEQLRLAGGPDANVAELLRQVELPTSYAERYPRQLSGGEQQRLALARALAANPPYLLLDEAFSALDPILRRELLGLVSGLGRTTILASHDPSLALPLSAQVIFLEAGRLLFSGPTSHFRASDSPLIHRYLEASAC
jgi:osmoprotectant transport system ATP-binding protein